MASKKYGMSTFIGVTSTGLQFPVFFDLHYPIAINMPPVALITGDPGSGKTFAGLTFAAHAIVLGKKTIIIDPKGDFIALRKLSRAGELPPVAVWSLFDEGEEGKINEKNVGMLDPLVITKDRSVNVALTLDIIAALVKEITHKQHNALIPILQDEVESPRPSMKNVMRTLQRSKDDEIRSLGFALETPLGLPEAKLLVSDPKSKEKIAIFDNPAVVVSLLGLSMPAMDKPRGSYSTSEKVSSCVMQLISRLALDVMMAVPKTTQKTLIIDEAWIVVGTEAGSNMINQVSLLGRSLNMATLLITQSPLHLAAKKGESASLDTTISTRFAFRSASARDNMVSREAMRMPPNDGWEQLFEALRQGQCVMKDCQGNLTIMHITVNDKWTEIFKTTPAPETTE